MTTYEMLNDKELARNEWKRWVALLVTAFTAKKSDRALCRSYGVKVLKSGLFQITLEGKPAAYEPMDAETLYGWMERLPLVYWVRKADDLRYDVLSSTPNK